jgi:hypothetical protein
MNSQKGAFVMRATLFCSALSVSALAAAGVGRAERLWPERHGRRLGDRWLGERLGDRIQLYRQCGSHGATQRLGRGAVQCGRT